MAGDLSVETIDPLLAIFVILFYAGTALLIGYRFNYFAYSLKQPALVPDLRDCGRVFALFLLSQFLLIPLFLYPNIKLNAGWLNLAGIFGIIGILSAFFISNRKKLRSLFTSDHPLFDFCLGMMSWLIAFPCAMAVSQIISYILTDLLGFTLEDQIAVLQMKQSLKDPFLFSATLIAIVFIVPVLEELMFRGYLQSAMRPLFGPKKAIVFSAALFSIFHFAFDQGVNNFNILGALFILALFLGFLRERQGNLLPSIALHTTFNAISVAMILQSQ